MKGKILGLAALVILFIACSKDKFQSKPRLELKSVNPKVVSSGGDGLMTLQLEYFDKEGDLSKDTLSILKVRNNVLTKPTLNDTLYFYLGDLPGKDHGVIEVSIKGSELAAAIDPNVGSIAQDDSLTLRVNLFDNASNRSDTLDIKDIVIKRS